MKMLFNEFHSVAPIGAQTVGLYGDQMPEGLVEFWQTNGVGFIGDGYFRLVDPARAKMMLAPVMEVPGPVILLTAMADFVYTAKGAFFIVKPRFNSIEITQMSFAQLVGLMDPASGARQSIWEWEPYPQAAAVGGVPGFEECYGFVPLLSLGGRPDPGSLQLGGVYQHIGINLQMGGGFQLRGMLPTPQEPVKLFV
jgi:hypothetical protein